jgi:hypothetical protein
VRKCVRLLLVAGGWLSFVTVQAVLTWPGAWRAARPDVRSAPFGLQAVVLVEPDDQTDPIVTKALPQGAQHGEDLFPAGSRSNDVLPRP